MIATNDFRTGMTIEIEGDAYTIVDFQHVKPGKGAAFVRTKLKNVRNGNVTERTFRAGEKVNRAHIEKKTMQYLYRSDEYLTFMDTETFEQISMTREQLGKVMDFIKESMTIDVLFYNGQTIGIEPPNFVELMISATDPGVKGDTVSGATKKAILETGAEIQVPLFINEGEMVKIDTRTGEYMERV